MAAASAAVAATTAATSATTTAATLSLRPRLIDNQVPPAEILPVQRVNCAIGIYVALHFHEGKTA
jgi:hypothetical protein